MQDKDYEKGFTVYCLIKALSMATVIAASSFLLSDLILEKLNVVRYVSWLLGLSTGLFFFFYASDFCFCNDDDNEV